MASQQDPTPDSTEYEPLLGRPGDAAQRNGNPIYENLILGTGVVAQAGIWILVALIWSGIFSHPLILFSSHPLLNSSGILLITQAALILQPTHTSEQRRLGTLIHATLANIGMLCLLAGFIVIEVNKSKSHRAHFESPHSIMGMITYILILIQSIVGVLQFFYPHVLGGEEKAKKVYKYHRMSGYVIFVLATATICAATWTEYNMMVLKIHHWSVITASVILLAGLMARIQKGKLGF
jgi:hypothetical protein